MINLDRIDQQIVKIDKLTRENLEKDHQCNQLIKEKEYTEEQLRHLSKIYEEVLSNHISKLDHKNAIQKIYNDNQIVVKEV